MRRANIVLLALGIMASVCAAPSPARAQTSGYDSQKVRDEIRAFMVDVYAAMTCDMLLNQLRNEITSLNQYAQLYESWSFDPAFACGLTREGVQMLILNDIKDLRTLANAMLTHDPACTIPATDFQNMLNVIIYALGLPRNFPTLAECTTQEAPLPLELN